MSRGASPLLAVEDLSVTFTGLHREPVTVVDHISYEVEAGASFGIVGESGSGKSVSAMSILRLLPQQSTRLSGAIRFEGRDVLTMPDKELAQLRGGEVGVVFQDPMSALDPVFTIGEQISESLRRHRGTSRAVARRQCIEMLDHVGITDAPRRFDEYPHQLSGGMRQRAMIAMALINEPKLLIADEPTTALDVTIQAQILRLLTRLRKESGLALILISHDIDVVVSMCERVVTMYAGQIVEAGPAEDVVEDPRHPYTRALLESAPRPGLERKAELPAIVGTPPSPRNFPTGCRFRPRCPVATQGCELPQSLEARDGRAVRCWRAQHLVKERAHG